MIEKSYGKWVPGLNGLTRQLMVSYMCVIILLAFIIIAFADVLVQY